MYYSNTKDIEAINFDKNYSYMVLVPEGEYDSLNKILDFLNSKGIKFFGGVFPYIVYQTNKYKEGIFIGKSGIIEDIKIVSMDGASGLNIFDKDYTTENNKTAIVFVDGFSTRIKNFLQKLHNETGGGLKFIGGGTGTSDLIQKPTVFSNGGLMQNAAVIAVLDKKAILESKHGWQILIGPLVASKVDGNKILELNWENPFKLYKKIIEMNSEHKLSKENFYEVASKFPFGFESVGHDVIVRDPLSVSEDGVISCVSDIPENSSLNILFGKKERLLESSTELLIKYQSMLANSDLNTVFVFDCISRVAFLGEEFDTELLNIGSNPKINVIGALTIGEIISNSDGYIDFLNKSLTLAILNEE